MNIDKKILAKRKQLLVEVSKQLKTEFFGLDRIIDKVIESVYAWYVFPELIKRPVIVNLWGMTGVGKTQLVRRLASLLDFSNKFVEIQMDGTSGGSTFKKDSICSILSNCINEGEAGILLLDEIQRFRTIDNLGVDVKVERFQDVWMLLSDGKFAANSDLFSELEMVIASQQFSHQNDTEETETTKKRMFKIYPWEAKMIKTLLRLPIAVSEIMTWDLPKIQTHLAEIKNNRIDWQIDYSKLIVFISGNLDSAFNGSGSTEDSDTDADFYHKLTSQITTAEIKRALGKRFKPEQISRLGSNHIIYPSMTKSSYQQLIKATCNKYILEMNEATGIQFSVEPELFNIIYNNAVYPTQGTRPVFSAIHKIFNTGLVNITSWCLENDVHDISLKIDDANQKMIATDLRTHQVFSTDIDLEISDRKAKISTDMKTLVAVHESGHALAYALLTKSAPIETKINAISFCNGYMLPNESLNTNNITTKKTLRNKIATLLGGMVAEEIVFGPDNRSSGCKSDIREATLQASLYVRHYGYDGTLGYINTEVTSGEVTWNTNLAYSNQTIETILNEEREYVRTLITKNFQFYRKIVDSLLDNNTLDQTQFIELAKEYMCLEKQAQNVQFHEQYRNFSTP